MVSKLFDFSIVACLIAAVASLLRGKRYVHDELHAGPGLAAGGVTAADLPAGLIEAEAGVVDRAPAEAGARPRVTVAEEIDDAERRLASPEPARRFRKER